MFLCVLLLNFVKRRKRKKTTFHTTSKENTDCGNVTSEKLIDNNRNVGIGRYFNEDRLVTVILFVLVALNTSLVSFVGYVTYKERESFYNESITEFPVPCEELSLSADEDVIMFAMEKDDLRTYIDENGKYICSRSNLTEVTKTVTERQSRLRLAKGLEEQYMSCGNESLAEKSGHLTISFTEISKHQNYSGESSDVKLHWDDHPDNFHIDPSIHYDNGEVTIPEGRTYFVYASARFNISRPEENGVQNFRRPQRFSIRICKNVYGYEQTLLGRTELFNTTNIENVMSSLSLEGHFELSRNDKIYVRVNDANKIIHDSKGNTFGLFPL